MKLDRNINPDGKGRYALIHLRKCTPTIEESGLLGKILICDAEAVSFGNPNGDTPGEQFFVLKYKDKFASEALNAYAGSVRNEAWRLRGLDQIDEAEQLEEFASEVEEEARKARALGHKTPTPLTP